MTKARFFKVATLFLLISINYAPAFSQNIFSAIKGAFSSSDKQKVSAEVLYDLSLEENLMLPDLDKYAGAIRDFQHKTALKIKRDGFKVETTREGEVIIVSIPVAAMFMPNDTLLCDGAKKQLEYFFRYLKVPDYYRVLLVMHTDNTGTASYTYNLSLRRIENVFKWIQSQNVNCDFIIPYAMGDKMPVYENTSLYNRAANRRLEIYLVPGSEMLRRAKKNQLQ